MSLFEKIILPIGKPPTVGGWVKWFHKGISDEEDTRREKARDEAREKGHCEICTVLSGDYFPSFNMPMYPQHPNCDCILFSIDKPASQSVADCPMEKFTGYLFGEKYANNGKVKLFKELGFTEADINYLKTEMERQALNKYLKGDFLLGKLDTYEQRITIAIELKSPIKNDIIIKTGWMIRPLGKITCNTPYGAK